MSYYVIYKRITMLEVIVRFIDIGVIVNHHCLHLLFIMRDYLPIGNISHG